MLGAHSENRNNIKLNHRIWLLFACLACVTLRSPALLWGVLSDDEAIYDAMAQEVSAGGIMYRDTVDHKPPGIVYTYAALEHIVGGGTHRIAFVHLCGVLVALATCLCLYWVGRHFLASHLAGVPPLLYALATISKVPCDGLAVNGELLMNLPTILAVGVGLQAREKRGLRNALSVILCGALLGVATLYKYQASIALLALPLIREPKPRSVRLATFGVSLLGFAAVLGACALYFGYHGALNDAIRWGVAFNRRYIAEPAPTLWTVKRFGLQFVSVVVPAAVLYGSALMTCVSLIRSRRKSSAALRDSDFLLTWSLLASVSVCIGGRYFGHYFIQPELPLSIVAAPTAARLFERHSRVFVAATASPAIAVAMLVAFAPALGWRIDDDTTDYETIAAAVAARTSADDTIWVWGNAPRIYFAADRRPGARFTFCNYLTGLSPGTLSEYDASTFPSEGGDNEAWALVLSDLTQRRPRLILDTAAGGLKHYAKFPIQRYPDLAAFITRRYRRAGSIQGTTIYSRLE